MIRQRLGADLGSSLRIKTLQNKLMYLVRGGLLSSQSQVNASPPSNFVVVGWTPGKKQLAQLALSRRREA